MKPGATSSSLLFRLRTGAASALVGRQAERDHLRNLVTERGGPAVVVVFGPGGIGKSMLVTATAAELELPSLMLDGRRIEPTPTGFLAAMAAELGSGPLDTPAQVSAPLQARQIRLIVVDNFDRLNLLDGWLRNQFVPALPTDLTTVLVGRRPANLAWRTAPGWRPLLAELEVGDMSSEDARALVARRRLSPEIAERVLHFGRGHPLALELAADAFARHTALELPDAPPPRILEELCEVLLDDLSPAEKRTAETAALLRRVTRPLLAAVLDVRVRGRDDSTVQDVDSAWRTLRSLPFVTVSRIGLELNPLARNVIAGGLEIRDPEFVVQVRKRAALAALHDADGARSWEATADLLYLVQNPVIRNSYVPPGEQQHPVETAVTDDFDAIMAISRRYDGTEGAVAIADWWESHPEGFVVGRGTNGEVTAFSVVVRCSQLASRLTLTDPVVAAVNHDLQRRTLPGGSEVLLHRRALGRRKGEYPSPELGSMIVDIKRVYLELRPRLARVYAVVADWDRIGPVLRVMGFGRVGSEVLMGDRAFHICALDFGPGSVDGWLARHVLAESGAETEAGEGGIVSPALPTAAERPPVARLSAREREVLTALADGLTNTELAERLFISERTANRHLSNIFGKLGVRNRTAAARIAIQAGLAG